MGMALPFQVTGTAVAQGARVTPDTEAPACKSQQAARCHAERAGASARVSGEAAAAPGAPSSSPAPGGGQQAEGLAAARPEPAPGPGACPRLLSLLSGGNNLQGHEMRWIGEPTRRKPPRFHFHTAGRHRWAVTTLATGRDVAAPQGSTSGSPRPRLLCQPQPNRPVGQNVSRVQGRGAGAVQPWTSSTELARGR